MGIGYDYVEVDLMSGEHKTPEHFQRHPLGKVPTLTHGEHTLFESNAICCYLANVEESPLYPSTSQIDRAKIEQWLSFFSHHLGRWINDYAFEKFIKKQLGFGESNQEIKDKALGFIEVQLPCINQHLEKNAYFLGENISIADYVIFAYFVNAELAGLSLTDTPAIKQWYQQLQASDVVQRAQKKLTQ